jgi:protoheme IX farnesyltransferase
VSIALAPVRVRRVALAWLELTKPRILLLVLMTALPALLIAARGFPSLRTLVGTLLGIAFASGSAAAFNHYLDRDIDGLMRRTASRPLPSGTLPPSAALGLGCVLAALSWLTLTATGTLLAAVLAQAGIVYYAVIYTIWLKRRTPQNIVVGGGAGAAAPLIAWAAVTGGVTPGALVLSSIVFLWTPPHFWALALERHDEYARAGIPMLPVTHGVEVTRRAILAYTVLLVPVTLTLQPMGLAGPLYTVTAAVLGAGFLALAARLWRDPRPRLAMGLFGFSILYLFALYLVLTLDAVLAATRAGRL